MRLLTLEEIKAKELDLLVDFDSFCKKNNLQYYLCGGTLLGAVRHGGFIPWDDDIDVCMPRPDYDRMIEIARKDHVEEIQAFELGNAFYPFAKYLDLDTELEMGYSTNSDDKHLWVDIFPIDGLPDDRPSQEAIYQKNTKYIRGLGLTTARLGEGSTLARKLSKFILKPLACLYGRKNWVNDLVTLSKQYSYEDATYVGSIAWGIYGLREVQEKSKFEQVTYKEFEGYTFPVFSNWEEYLISLYGDYMQLPPVEKRLSHNMTVYVKE